MRTLLSIFVLFAAFCSMAVQPPTGGAFEMAWQPLVGITNPIDYCVWETTNAGARWKQIGETRGTNFFWTNRTINPATHFYAITALPWMPYGVRQETEMKLLHWAPTGTITNASGYVKLRAIDAPAAQRIKLSSDLMKWDDWLTLRAFDGTNELTNATICIEHSTSPDKPRLFYGYPAAVVPPLPQ